MLPLALIVTTCLLRVTWAYSEDPYPLSDPDAYLEDLPDDGDFGVRRRSDSNFLRFGRSKFDPEYDDYGEDFARPTRSGKAEKNDHFIRFGRGKQDFLRFGRDQERPVRGKNELHLRFGRSMEARRRGKREAYPDLKRAGSSYLRFGRNSNFLRFGRNEMATAEPEKEAPLLQLLNELLAALKKEQAKDRIV